LRAPSNASSNHLRVAAATRHSTAREPLRTCLPLRRTASTPRRRHPPGIWFALRLGGYVDLCGTFLMPRHAYARNNASRAALQRIRRRTRTLATTLYHRIALTSRCYRTTQPPATLASPVIRAARACFTQHISINGNAEHLFVPRRQRVPGTHAQQTPSHLAYAHRAGAG